MNKCKHTACPRGTDMAVLGEIERGDSLLTTVDEEGVLAEGNS